MQSKHIIQENPLALKMEDCDAIISAVEAAGVSVVVGHKESYWRRAFRVTMAIYGRGTTVLRDMKGTRT